jgi:DNA-binding GntR family transcriptional regulator
VEYLSLAEIAYQKIKQAILKHEIVPGQRLSHEELVLRLKISQTPIREALSRLAQEGYVTRLTNRGYRVSEMTAEEVEELSACGPPSRRIAPMKRSAASRRKG